MYVSERNIVLQKGKNIGNNDFSTYVDVIPFTAFHTTDYGRPMKPFFIKIQSFWAWADKLGR